MKISDVNGLLLAHKNERGIANWKKLYPNSKLRCYGLGLTQLRKLAKTIGRDRQLSQQLWKEPCYDAKIISLLIDDPKQITREQAEAQVEDVNIGLLTHVFSSCDATLAKSKVALALAADWIDAEDENRKKCAYGLWYELSKKKSIDDQLFMNVVDTIDERVDNESKRVRLAMGGALMGIGKRSISLNKAALKVAQRTGPIDFNEGNQKCDPLDVVKHLTSDYLKKKLGI